MCISNNDGLRAGIVGVRGDDSGKLNCTVCRGETKEELVAGDGTVEKLEVDGVGNFMGKGSSNEPSSLESSATRAMTCSMGTLEVPSGIYKGKHCVLETVHRPIKIKN